MCDSTFKETTDLILTFEFFSRVGLAAVPGSSPASAAVGRAISQSLAVDETIMPTAADSSTLCIADTEEQTW